MDQLEQKLLDYRNIIDQQERMLQQQVASGNGDHGTPRLVRILMLLLHHRYSALHRMSPD